jgi:hypothetical protein
MVVGCDEALEMVAMMVQETKDQVMAYQPVTSVVAMIVEKKAATALTTFQEKLATTWESLRTPYLSMMGCWHSTEIP